MNWYKKIARFPGASEDLAQEYSEGYRPHNEGHHKDPRAINLTTPVPQFGGQRNELSRLREDEDRYLTRGRKLPGENVLMDNDPPVGEGANDDRFVPTEDKLPKGLNNNSVRLDKGLPPIDNVFKRLKKRTKRDSFTRL